MKTRELLVAAVAAVMMTSAARAEKTAKAVVADSGATLRFVYDDVDYGTKGTDWFSVSEAETNALSLGYVPWSRTRSKLTRVVFEASFGGYRPTRCLRWFDGFGKLGKVEGLANLDTSEATSMAYMFYCCSSLTSLNFSGSTRRR